MDKRIENFAYAELVNEVLEFAYSDKLLPVFDESELSQDMETDIDEAFRHFNEITHGQEEYLWFDVVNEEIAKVNGIYYREPEKYKEIDTILGEIMDELSSYFFRKYKKVDYDSIQDPLVTDLYSCMLSRAAVGQNNSFWEQVFEVYKDGGWPCGWSGQWPDGKFKVFKRAL